MINKNTLIAVYESVLITLLNERKSALHFYINQNAFSHMSLSVEFWHYDINWQIHSHPETHFSPHHHFLAAPFITLSDFEEDHSHVYELRDIMESWEKLEQNGDGTLEDMLCLLSHEALAEALNKNTVKSLLLILFSENPALQTKSLHELVIVKDPDGRFDKNFMNVAA